MQYPHIIYFERVRIELKEYTRPPLRLYIIHLYVCLINMYVNKNVRLLLHNGVSLIEMNVYIL